MSHKNAFLIKELRGESETATLLDGGGGGADNIFSFNSSSTTGYSWVQERGGSVMNPSGREKKVPNDLPLYNLPNID